MAYIIDQNGNRVEVDIPCHPSRSVRIYADNLNFNNDIYLLNLYRMGDSIRTSHELVEQVRLSCEPTKEDILYWFSYYDMGNMDFYTIEKGKILGWAEE